MNIECEKEKMIFKKTTDKGTFYSIGLSKKDKSGKYTNGYMTCKFQKDTTIEDRTKIKIHEAWLDFYIKDKITYPYIFINKFEIVQENIQEAPQNIKTNYSKDSDIQLTDDDIDKTFNNDNLELPF